ncbi:DUF2283 domain-containing protein [Prauserella alba]|uniref:DUF2283 domain-containing protein n=1 Tax=Prauserella alba TaxID=176898 RepID=A0ABN1V537_9PSEU
MESFWPVVEVDQEANSAYISMSDPGSRGKRSLPVRDDLGDVVAVLDFDNEGALVGVELLDAARQVPNSLRSRVTYIQ